MYKEPTDDPEFGVDDLGVSDAGHDVGGDTAEHVEAVLSDRS